MTLFLTCLHALMAKVPPTPWMGPLEMDRERAWRLGHPPPLPRAVALWRFGGECLPTIMIMPACRGSTGLTGPIAPEDCLVAGRYHAWGGGVCVLGTALHSLAPLINFIFPPRKNFLIWWGVGRPKSQERQNTPPPYHRETGSTTSHGKGKGSTGREGKIGQGGRGWTQGGERLKGTNADGGKGSKGRAVSDDRPIGAASCRPKHTTVSHQIPHVTEQSPGAHSSRRNSITLRYTNHEPSGPDMEDYCGCRPRARPVQGRHALVDWTAHVVHVGAHSSCCRARVVRCGECTRLALRQVAGEVEQDPYRQKERQKEAAYSYNQAKRLLHLSVWTAGRRWAARGLGVGPRCAADGRPGLRASPRPV